MSIPFFSWCAIAGFFAGVVLFRFFKTIFSHAVSKHRRRLISLGSEREEIFVPGDLLRENNDYDDDI